MPLINQGEIHHFVDLLNQKGINLFHSCQLIDFESYLKLGGIPSRNLLKNKGLPMTQFETDSNDIENEVWDKVFVNLVNYGNFFSLYNMNNQNTASTPNVYGPISIEIYPSALNYCSDMCLSLKSAGMAGFNREQFGISIQRAHEIFDCINCVNPEEETYIKRTEELRKTFNMKVPGALNPEINLTKHSQLIEYDWFLQIKVDNISLEGVSLLELVNKKLVYYGFKANATMRPYHYTQAEERIEILHLLALHLKEEDLNLARCLDIFKSKQYAFDWCSRLQKGGLTYQLNRYLKYLKEGTIQLMC